MALQQDQRSAGLLRSVATTGSATDGPRTATVSHGRATHFSLLSGKRSSGMLLLYLDGVPTAVSGVERMPDAGPVRSVIEHTANLPFPGMGGDGFEPPTPCV